MEAGTFDRLASELSLEERGRLLDRLNNQSSLSREPLYEEAADTPSFDLDEEYKHIPWYYYLFFVLLGFFKKKTPRQIFAEYMVSRLGRVIDAKAPDFYNCQRDLLLPEFHKYLISLKEGARFFYSALDSSVNRDKGAFYAFLASLEMGEVHKRLSAETDPAVITDKNPGLPEAGLRQIAFEAMEDSMAAVTEEQRKTMYNNTRFLYCLKEIASFLYDRIILAFSRDNEAKGPVCTARVVEDQLFFLNNILYSLKEIPPMTLLESLFIFILQDHVGEPGFEINTEMRNLLVKAESSLSAIREFNKQVPLTLILRCTSRNMSLSPKAIGGGEDWFVVYREHWKRRIETQFTEYMRLRRHRDLTNSFRYFLKGTNLKVLSNVVSDSSPNGMPIKKAFALSFLLTFYSVVFMGDINKTVRPILIDGEFYKRENRTEFTEAYNELIKLEDVIHKFETEISPDGNYGKRYYQARGDMTSLPVKRRKIQLVMEEADRDAEHIVERVREAIQSMINVLNGIVRKDPNGKYDTLGNLSRFTVGKGAALINNVSDAVQKLQKTLQLLDNIDEMESNK
jgi:hypothetical protein